MLIELPQKPATTVEGWGGPVQKIPGHIGFYFGQQAYAQAHWPDIKFSTAFQLQMFREWMENRLDSSPAPISYGVADSIEQIETHPEMQKLLQGERTLVVFITFIKREEQPSEGGWRWHKWGPYIGNKNPDCEYIYDQNGVHGDLVDEVYCFNTCEVSL